MASASMEAVKLISLKKGSKLEVHAEGRDCLQTESGLVNAVMVCGNLRTGKSYILNALAGCHCFGVSSRARGFTSGVDLMPQLLAPTHFGAAEEAPKVALLDVEGHGEKGLSQDVKLATPPLLVSKVVLFKEICPNGPSPEKILDALKVMMMAASSVSNRKARGNLFGHLHLILRDCCNDEEECSKIIFEEQSREDAHNDEHACSISRFNSIRQDISFYFEGTPRVWCLPKLPDNEAPQDYRQASVPAYVEKIQDLRTTLGQQLAEPKLVDGKKLTGVLMDELVQQIAETISGDDATPQLNPPALMDRVMDTVAERIVKSTVEQVQPLMLAAKALLDQLPLAEKQLTAKVEELHGKLSSALKERLENAGIFDDASNDRFMKCNHTLDSEVQRCSATLHEKNEALLEQHADGICRALADQTRKEFKALEKQLPIAATQLERMVEEQRCALDLQLESQLCAVGAVESASEARFERCHSKLNSEVTPCCEYLLGQNEKALGQFAELVGKEFKDRARSELQALIKQVPVEATQLDENVDENCAKLERELLQKLGEKGVVESLSVEKCKEALHNEVNSRREDLRKQNEAALAKYTQKVSREIVDRAAMDFQALAVKLPMDSAQMKDKVSEVHCSVEAQLQDLLSKAAQLYGPSDTREQSCNAALQSKVNDCVQQLEKQNATKQKAAAKQIKNITKNEANTRFKALLPELPVAEKLLIEKLAKMQLILEEQLSQHIATAGFDGQLSGPLADSCQETLALQVKQWSDDLLQQNKMTRAARVRGHIKRGFFGCLSVFAAAMTVSAPVVWDAAAITMEAGLLSWYCKEPLPVGSFMSSFCATPSHQQPTDDHDEGSVVTDDAEPYGTCAQAVRAGDEAHVICDHGAQVEHMQEPGLKSSRGTWAAAVGVGSVLTFLRFSRSGCSV